MRSLEVPVYVQDEVDDLHLAACNSTILREIERNLKERLRHEIKPECLDCKHSQVTKSEEKLFHKMATAIRLRVSCLHVERAGKCVQKVERPRPTDLLSSFDAKELAEKMMLEGSATTSTCAAEGDTLTREGLEKAMKELGSAPGHMTPERFTTPRHDSEFSDAELRELEKVIRPKDRPRTEGFGDW